MLTEYRINADGKIIPSTADLSSYDAGVVWLDALYPDDGDLARLGEIMGFDVPNRHDMTEIELSNRLYKDGDAHVMIASLLPKSDTEVLPPRPVAFIVSRNLLLTIRYSHFFSFERMASKLPRSQERQSPQTIFTSLLDEAVSDRADNLEFSMRHMETLTSRLFRTTASARESGNPENPELEEALLLIGGMGERVSNIRESIASLQRVLNYAQTYIPNDWMGDRKAIMNSMKTDLTALSDEAAFFMNKLAFNLDATLGMINIEETKIIRVLSVVTLVLSPPVVIAGIYGMNFNDMPELTWPHGYLFSLILMAVAALLPVWYLKRKKWL